MTYRRIVVSIIAAGLIPVVAPSPARAQSAAQQDTFSVDGAGNEDLAGGPRDAAEAQSPSPRLDTFGIEMPAESLTTASLPASRPAAPAVPISRNPYAALGLRAGAFVIYPEILSGIAFDDNVFQGDGSDGGGDVSYRLVPSLRLESDWPRHRFSLEMSSSNEFFSGSASRDIHEADIAASARIDIRERTRVDLSADYALSEDRRASADVSAAAAELPDQHDFGASAQITQRFNRLSVSLRGAIADTTVEDTALVGGGTQTNKDRNYYDLSGTLRGSYEVSPALQPFAEMTVSRRNYDQRTDDNGQRRDSQGYVLAGGAAINLGPILSGEIAGGFLRATFEDPSFRDIGDVFVRASVTWAPTALTTLSASVATGVEETTIVGASGAVRRTLELALRHALRQNIIVSASLTFEREDFKGSPLVEETFATALGIEYRFNRYLAAVLRYGFEDFSDNSNGGGGFTSNSVFVGLNARK